MNDLVSHLVIDNGSDSLKVGFNAENAPRAVVPSLVGYEWSDSLVYPLEKERTYVTGSAVYDKFYDLDVRSPIVNGRIVDFDAMEKLWDHAFSNELKVSPEAFSVFLTESLNSSRQQRETMAEIMFEKFSIFNLHIQPQPYLSIYTSAKTSGVVVESGHGLTQIVPIYEGYILHEGLKVTELAGQTVEKSLQELLKRQFRQFGLQNSNKVVKEIKEKFADFTNVTEKEYELPDGNILRLTDEVQKALSVLFDDENELDMRPIDQLAFEAIEAVDINLKTLMYSSIIVGGGNTAINKFDKKLESKLKSKVNDTNKEVIKIVSSPEQKYSAWLGAAVLCSFGTFKQMWVSKSEFNEHGDRILNRNYC